MCPTVSTDIKCNRIEFFLLNYFVPMARVCVIGLQGDALSFHPHVPPPPFPPGLALNIFFKICWWNSKVLICKKTLKNLYLLLLSWFILVYGTNKKINKKSLQYLLFVVKWNLWRVCMCNFDFYWGENDQTQIKHSFLKEIVIYFNFVFYF